MLRLAEVFFLYGRYLREYRFVRLSFGIFVPVVEMGDVACVLGVGLWNELEFGGAGDVGLVGLGFRALVILASPATQMI